MKEREHALQSLDLAYHKYREVTRNLDEGLKVPSLKYDIPAHFDRKSVLQPIKGDIDTIQGILQDMESSPTTRNAVSTFIDVLTSTSHSSLVLCPIL